MKDKEYKDNLIFIFKLLLEIYDVKTAILFLYKFNDLRGKKI